MATVEELIKQYDTDPELKKEVDGILADQKITIGVDSWGYAPSDITGVLYDLTLTFDYDGLVVFED